MNGLRQAFASTLFLVLATATGCGGGDDHAAVDATTNTEPRETSSPTPTPPTITDETVAEETTDDGGGGSPSPLTISNERLGFYWTDKDGYKRHLYFDHLRVEVTDTNTADQRPGEAMVTYTVSGDAVVENLTPGRNTQPGLTGITVSPVYAWDSAVCADVHEPRQWDNVSLVVRDLAPLRTPTKSKPGEITIEMGPEGDYKRLPYCLHTGAEQDPSTPDEPIPADGSASFTFVRTYQRVIAESLLDRYVDAITNPAFWALHRPLVALGNVTVAGRCERGVWSSRFSLDDGVKQTVTGYENLVATSEAGLDICPWLTEEP